jgi:hypothetical protein
MTGLGDGHRAELEQSGLSEATIQQARLFRASGPMVRELLGYGAGPALVFPYFALDGTPLDYVRVKLDQAPPDGKRYRSPAKQPNRLYFPPLCDWARIAKDPREPLYITEGQKKALKAGQEGLNCLGLAGVWSWLTRYRGNGILGASHPIPDLDLIVWTGRTVYLVFDSDAARKPDVQAAERRLGRELIRRGAIVKIIRLPDDGVTKVGLDDYLCRHSVEAFCALEPQSIPDERPRRRRSLIVIPLSEIQAKPVTWLWLRRLARGKLIIIAGDPGVGKSFVDVDIHGRLSTGTAWPDETEPRVPVPSLLLSAEDSPSDTIKIRFEDQGADHRLIHLVTAVRVGDRGALDLFSLGTDLDLLEATVRETGAQLVSIDPLNSYLPVRDSFKDSDIRRALAPLVAFAERTEVTVLCIMHLTKDRDRQALYRILGGIGYVGTARVVLIVANDPQTPGRRYLVSPKINIGRKAAPLAFTIEELPEERARLVWDTQVPLDLDVEALVRGVLPDYREEHEARQAAQDFLHEALEHGPEWSAAILQAAKQNGHALRTLFRAKRDLKIQARKAGGHFGGGKQAWYWWLPGTPETPPTPPRPEDGQGGGTTEDGHAMEGGGNLQARR